MKRLAGAFCTLNAKTNDLSMLKNNPKKAPTCIHTNQGFLLIINF